MKAAQTRVRSSKRKCCAERAMHRMFMAAIARHPAQPSTPFKVARRSSAKAHKVCYPWPTMHIASSALHCGMAVAPHATTDTPPAAAGARFKLAVDARPPAAMTGLKMQVRI